MNTQSPALTLTAVRKTFHTANGPFEAAAGIDLSVGTGEIVAFLGPNGAGKTTTIDMMLGLTAPSSGTVSVFGKSPRAAVADGDVSAVLQTGGLLRGLTVQETVTAIAALHKAKDRIGSVMERPQGSRSSRLSHLPVIASAIPVSGLLTDEIGFYSNCCDLRTGAYCEEETGTGGRDDRSRLCHRGTGRGRPPSP